jgi:magnesium-transporting ATPase (P-type)
LERCSSIIIEGNNPGEQSSAQLTPELREKTLKRQENLGQNGLRVIALCAQRVDWAKLGQNSADEHKKGAMEGFPADNYLFLGMFGLLDPPRAEAADAVLRAQRAGIRVAMVTGDHSVTATAIARQVNIIPRHLAPEKVFSMKFAMDEMGRAVIQVLRGVGSEKSVAFSHVVGSNGTIEAKNGENYPGEQNDAEPSSAAEETPSKGRNSGRSSTLNQIVAKMFTSAPIKPRPAPTDCAVIVSGAELRLFDSFLWNWVLSQGYLVFARTSPEQKLKIVAEAQLRAEIVAVTGDGVNDAPALKQSNLGVAMQNGADVAREAGDLVLLDNNFASIINAIETGRTVSDNIKKVCLYLMVGGTYCEVWAVLTNVALAFPLPLSSFQMIFISIGCDILNSLALVQEKPEQAIMQRAPVDRRLEKLVDWRVVLQAYGFFGTIATFAAMFCYFWYFSVAGNVPAGCIFFAYSYQVADPFLCSGRALSLADQNELVFTAQSIYFVSLLIVNWFQMFATRTRYSSILQHNPVTGKGQNLWLFASLGAGIAVAAFVLNVPWFNEIFNTRPVPVKFVCPAIGFGGLLLLFDEFRKWHVRSYPGGFFARIAW